MSGRRAIALLSLAIALALTSACGGGGSGPPPPPSAPTLASLQPSSISAGSAGFVLTVNGSGFVTDATVLWNGAARTTTFVSGGAVSATISAADVAQQGSAAITATNPGTSASNALTFTITAPLPNPVPSLQSLTPAWAQAGTSSVSLRVQGMGFVPASKVRWNGSDRPTTYVDSTHLTATLTGSDTATPAKAQVSVFNPTPGGGVSGELTFTVTAAVKGLALPVNRLLYDPGRQKIYASVPSRAGSPSGDTIAIIDPATAAVTGSISVGSEPDAIAISQDGKFLYVGLDGDGSIRRIDLETNTAGLQFSLGTDPSLGTMYATDIAVMPGNSDVLAVSRSFKGWSPSGAGVAIFDNGVQRPNTTDRFSGANRIEFSDSPSTLYGLGTDYSRVFVRMAIDAAGVSVLDTQEYLVSGSDVKFDSGRIYSSNGDVIDPVRNVPLGKFSGLSWPPSFAPDTAAGRAYYLVQGSSTDAWNIVGYDTNTFLQLGVLVAAGVGSYNAQAGNLLRWGSTGFAFSVSDKVWITTGPFTPDPPTQLSLKQLPVKRIVYDAGRDRIYASVPSSAGGQGNSVAVINPATASLETTIFVGSEPNVLALSPDGKYLYVGLDGGAGVRRVDLANNTADLQFTLGITRYGGPNLPLDIAVMPGQPGTVAVANRYGGIALFDDGTRRASLAEDVGTAIEFADSTTLYAYSANQGAFRRLTIDASGISVAFYSGRLIDNWYADIVYDSGRIYTTGGTVIDPTVPDMAIAGRFVTTINYYWPVALAPDASAGRAYYMISDGVRVNITAYDLATFVPVGSLQVAGYGGGSSLIRCGGTGFAFIRSERVKFANGTFTPWPVINRIDQLPANSLIYDRGRQRIYVSVPSRAGARGNTITIINPSTFAMEASVYIGSEPDIMALSDDGRYLYVGLDGAAAVRQLDLNTHAAGLQFALGRDSWLGTMYPEDISVAPGNSTLVAVSRRYPGVSPSHAGVAVFDNGVPRPNKTPGHTGSDKIEFSDSPSLLYGYSSGGDFALRWMTVDANGLSVIKTVTDLFRNGGGDFAYQSGLIYGTAGAVVDPATETLLGTFPNTWGSKAVVPDPTAGRAYFLSIDGGSAVILGYSTAAFAPIGSVTVPGATGAGNAFARWGESGLAVALPDKVVITYGRLPEPKPLTVATTAVPPTMPGRFYDYTVAATGGIAPYTWTLAGGSLPPALTLSTDGRISGTVGEVTADTPFTFTLQVSDSNAPAATAIKDLTIEVRTRLDGNGSCATATPISFGRLAASLSPYGDIDVYSFDGTGGHPISIETFAQRLELDGDPSTIDSQADTFLELLDNNCSVLTSNDDISSDQLDSRIGAFVLPYTGKYFIRVSDARGDGRPDLLYHLSLQIE